jgi:hypothetical protein
MGIEENYRSNLKVKLSFKKDVPPRDYDGVKHRLELPKETISNTTTSLSDYLYTKEFLKINGSYGSYGSDFSQKRRKVSIKSNKRKMTLEVSVESQKTLEPDELLNVVNLYNFISTGKSPKSE